MTKEQLRGHALELGFSSLGVCEALPAAHHDFYMQWLDRGYQGTMQYLAEHAGLKADPKQLLPGARSVIVVTLDYNQPVESRPSSPHIARYALGRNYHKLIRAKLRKLQARIGNDECRVCVDSAPLLEREYAMRAGLGWFGKNTCLIDSRRGSWFFLGALLTTAEFEPDEPAQGGCGSCTLCIDTCPTGAIVFEDGRWQVDSRRCISYLTIEHRGEVEPALAEEMGDWTFGCDICQEVCPFNEVRSSQPLRGGLATEPDLLAHRSWPSLGKIAEIGHEEWDLLTRGSAVRRAGYAGLKRNAAINLANQVARKAKNEPK